MFDDEAVISAPIYFLAHHRTADMYSNDIKLNVYHNFLVDGKFETRPREGGGWLEANNITALRGAGPTYEKLFPSILAAGYFSRGKNCIAHVKHGS